MQRIKWIALSVTMLLLLESCSPKLTFTSSSVVPAATGQVKVKRDKNNNYLVNVEVMNLAPADRLTPPQQAYIVWMDSDQNSVKKLGLLSPSSNLLSKALKADLSATAVAKPTRVFVTAERTPDIQYPAGIEVLTTNRQ